MSAVDYVAFFVPLVFIAVLWRSWDHFLQHPLALGSLLLLTLVSILHFDVGMLASDPYDDLLDEIGAPRHTWAASVALLIVGSYSGDVMERLRGNRRVRRGRGSERLLDRASQR